MEKTSYKPGTPIWVDLSVPDVDKAAAFYGGLFGWVAAPAGSVEETGGYCNFTLRGVNVAGVAPAMGPGPSAWSTYFCVTDADATVAKAKELGATCVAEPMDVLEYGRMAVLVDPTGAAFSLWQPGSHKGAGLVNEADTWCWNELNTRDMDASKAFYSALLGAGMGGSPEYAEVQVDGESVAGIMPMPEMVPAEVPPHWLVYMAVDDCDAAAAKAQALGGSLLAGPMDVPVGRFAVLADDQGATFAVIKMVG